MEMIDQGRVTFEQLDDFIDRAIMEDVGTGDYTSLACIHPESRSDARLIIKDAGVIAGVDLAAYVFKKLDPASEFIRYKQDGASVSYGDTAFKVSCNTQALLKVERVILNCMQRMSGIATLSNRFAFEVEDLPVKILDTRKTTPLLRFLEKWAVRSGGCTNYRIGLYDRFMIKDNHIDACGGIRQAIERVRAYEKEQNLNLALTVEVRNLVELHEVLELGMTDRIMLDNFDLLLLKEAVHTVDRRVETEASGGVTIHNVREIALTGVDFISVGALTHSFHSLDMSLKVE